MNRAEVIQKIINKIKAKTYLEIGVEYGSTFLKIRAKKKIAVDPSLKISWKRKIYYLPEIFKMKFYKMTSDEFFARRASIFSKNKIDVAFIDGLHTFEQSLNDVENCLKYLSQNGVIIMHDCLPASEAAACPSSLGAKKMNSWQGEWCGDVWKTIVNLRSQRDDLNIFVLDTDRGIGIIKRGQAENKLNFSETEINKMDYNDFEKNKKEFLNLKPVEYFNDFLKV
ncbi:MAG: class I SAM-dependent methyltransferase [Patescibacteria group bacterium]